MKRFLVVFAIILALFSVSCTTDPKRPDGDDGGDGGTAIEIKLGTFPVGGWDKKQTVSDFVTSFNNQHSDIKVLFEDDYIFSYEKGDQKIAEMLEDGTAPDMILEGPERLVANWGANGHMATLNDLWAENKIPNVYDSVRNACHDGEENYYIYPMCMTTHCMAINYDMFEEAGALEFINEQDHSWTRDGFVKAVAALRAHFPDRTVAKVYCGGQGGDQGTRALVTNLYGGKFTDEKHTKYTVDSEDNIRALELLKGMDGIEFDKTIVGSDEIELFCDGQLAMAFCWNQSIEVMQLQKNPNFGFDVFPMAFPSENGDDALLQSGIWGFGIFDHGDSKRVEAAKTFIRYIIQDPAMYKKAVLASAYWPVYEMPQLYEGDAFMSEYSIFLPRAGDFYQVADKWAEARTAWWQMLQSVADGSAASEAAAQYFPQGIPAPKQQNAD